ncbi:MAG TPA: hypothetical protein VND68_06855 [Chloroflexia bacterium]|jgi:hypothetical protein|nr:hypothetical protein [Chloroflexia bacterium]
MSRIVRVDLIDTLMAWVYDLEVHVQSGDRESTFYFSVPDSWASEPDNQLQLRVYETMQQMYSDLNARLHAAEPNDLGYLLAKSTRATPLTPEELAARPWLQAPAPAIWEWTPCVVVAEDGTYTKVAPEEFAG